MKKEIVINASKDRARIAIVEDGELVELYVQHPENARTLGNIYLGRVAKAMPQIHAAFVDIGQRQDAFLHFSDLTDNAAQLFAIAGQQIPGLESGPILSKAPKKRVADDESEPDVEETLEVEETEAESNTARSRSRRRRRRGGRGRRGRGNSSQKTEEEEEEEERRLPHVIDLTKKTGSIRDPKPSTSESATPPASAETAEEPEASDDAQNEPTEEKPKRTRSRSRKKKDETPSTENAPTEESAAESAPDEPSTESEPAESEAAAEEKPKRSRSRSRKKKDDETPSSEAPAPDESADATPEAETPVEEEKPKRSRSRSRKKKDEAPPAEETPETDAQETSETETKRKELPSTIDLTSKPKPARPARREEPADKEDDPTADEKPKRSRSRSRSKSDDSANDSAEETSETTEADEKPDRSRSRRGRPRKSDEPTPEAEEKEDTSVQNDSDRSGRSRRGRSKGSDDRNTSGDDRKSKDDSDSRSGGRGRGNGQSNRQRNGGSAKPSASAEVPTKPEDLLSRGSRVLVKITKEPISSKGSRVSTDISLAGRFLVLVPAADYVAVSKKIESAKERRRLRTLATSLKPDNFGVIVRTVAEGREAKVLDQDLRLLVDKWRKIEKKLDGKPEPPVLLYEDVNMVSSIIRDLFTEDYDRILVDDPTLHKNLQSYVRAVAPQMADRVVLHRSNTPVFRATGLEKQVAEAFSERVNMKGGGYLIIEHTEAMHVIDVNSGRAGRGQRRAEENLLNVNIEAAREIAKQLRLRDLGGIIVVDFIDLRYERDRRKVTDAIKKEFAKDRAVTKVIGMSDFGVMQITRQRLRPSITTQSDEDAAPEDAMAAAGAAEIPQDSRRRYRDEDTRDESPDRAAEADDRPRRSRRQAMEELTPVQLAERVHAWLAHYHEVVDARYAKRPIVVGVHPLMASFLRRGFPSTLTRWKFRLRGLPFLVEEDAKVDPLEFAVRDQKSGRSLLSKYSPSED